jgi:aminocarboxymuconate-semialdehyde decarboxylase
MALDILDFHSHVAGTAHAVSPLLCDPRALMASLDEQGISARAISTPPEFLGGETPARANERIAETVRSDRRLIGLATVDAYAGDAGARELERAVRDLGLRGVFVESANGDRLPDAAEAQPTFAAAASLHIPVFLHPVPDRALKTRFAKCGRASERLTRGAINSAAVFAMIESGMFERHAGLKVVVTALALGGLLLGGPLPAGLYIDTTGHHPAMLRASLELLGPVRVVAGTDWPVVQEKSLAERLDGMLQSFGLDADDRQRVAGGNARALLGL